MYICTHYENSFLSVARFTGVLYDTSPTPAELVRRWITLLKQYGTPYVVGLDKGSSVLKQPLVNGEE